VIEHHRHVTAERFLNLDGVFGGQPNDGTVQMAFEGGRLLGDPIQFPEAEDLKPAAVGQDRPVPEHHPVQPTELLDQLVTWSEAEVIGVGQHHLGAGGADLIDGQSLDSRLRADGHEGRGLDIAAGRAKHTPSGTGRAIRVAQLEGECWHVG